VAAVLKKEGRKEGGKEGRKEGRKAEGRKGGRERGTLFLEGFYSLHSWDLEGPHGSGR
jgi:hypothetical protein